MASAKKATAPAASSAPTVRVGDGISNMASAIGTAKDKRSFDSYFYRQLSPEQVATMYRGDWVSGKVVDIIPADMTRQWRTWKASAEKREESSAEQDEGAVPGAEPKKKPGGLLKTALRKVKDFLPSPGTDEEVKGDKSQVELIEKEEKRLRLKSRVKWGVTLARLYGGAGIVIVTGDGKMDTPLEKVGKGGIKNLLVLSRYELNAEDTILDPNDAGYGTAKMYSLANANGQLLKIHPSRVIRLIGQPNPAPFQGVNANWGDSVLDRVYDAVNMAARSPGQVSSLMDEAKVDVVNVPGLSRQLSTIEGTAQLQKRFVAADQLKSLLNTLLLDAEETHGTKTINFSQFPELLRAFVELASGASDIPVTRFYSTSPKGMNATGDSDFRQYYDRIKGDQETLGEAMELFDELLIQSALGSRPAEIYYEWASLWQMTDKERAEIEKMDAETMQIHQNLGVIPTDAFANVVVNKLVEKGVYPGLDKEIAASDLTPGEHALETEEAERELAEMAAAGKAEAMKAGAGKVPPRAVKDAAPRTLYVRRDVLNGKEILAWAKAQGFKTTLAADDLHVTITYSKTPLDWLKVSPDWGSESDGGLTVQPGGPRVVEPLGDKGAVVLLFRSWRLEGRHKEILEAGASSDYPEYQPHVTITYEVGDVDISKVEPYRGEIVLGPEIFEEVKGFDPAKAA